MAILKCKMCGGDIEVNADRTFGTCDSCGSTMTLPKIDDERRANVFNRANHFRRLNDFDKAINAYERILSEDDTDAEAYWGVVLSRYGIEYVEDPKTHARIPTCHRVQTDSILVDADYLAALEHAPDGYTRSLYEQEAKRIAEIQKDILAISSREEPCDVFICYKETTDGGTRTKDSAIAQDVYYQLTNEGYKVFFSRITLEDKLGQQYEPYIFAALHSARVMVVIGTSAENFSAVWVKNEWSRFLDLMKRDRSKLLIPCYRDMDPYDLPEELSMLQSQDMAKIGFMQDLIRGVKKVLDAGKSKPMAAASIKADAQAVAAPGVVSLCERGMLFLEDGEWQNADTYFDRALDIDPKYALAYVGKLCAELGVCSQDKLPNCAGPFDEDSNYKKALRFGDAALKAKLTGAIEQINARNEEERLNGLYLDARAAMDAATGEVGFIAAAKRFGMVSGYRDADEQAAACREKAEDACKNGIYDEAMCAIRAKTVSQTTLYMSKLKLESISGWRDADAQAEACQAMISKMQAAKEQERIERERKAEQERIERERQAELERIAEAARRKKKIRTLAIALPTAALVIAFAILLTKVILPARDYEKGEALLAVGDYDGAILAFTKARTYQDASERIPAVFDAKGEALLAAGDDFGAAQAFALARDVEKAHTLVDFDIMLSTYVAHTVGLRTDGTVVATVYAGDSKYNFCQCDVQDWRDIVAVSAGNVHTVGLRADGTVVAVGTNDSGRCDVQDWLDIVAVSAGSSHTVGLRANGTVVAVGNNTFGQCDVQSWRDIVAVSAGEHHTVGLKADGTAVAVGRNGDGQCDVQNWRDIVAVSAGEHHTVGLRADSTAVAVGNNNYGQSSVQGWHNIMAVSAGVYHTVGLRADGTTVAVGNNDYGQSSVQDWYNIVAVSAGVYHTVGLRADGTVVATMYAGDPGTNYGQCNVQDWKLW